MEGLPDPFSLAFPPFFDNPTIVFTFSGLTLKTEIPSTTAGHSSSQPSIPTPTSSSAHDPIPPPPTRTITQTEIRSVSNLPANTLSPSLPSSNTTTIVLHNVTATLTETSVLLPAESSPSSEPSFSSQHFTQLSRNAIVGIALGIFAAVILVLSLTLFMLCRRKRARQRDEERRPHVPHPPLSPSGTQSIWSRYDLKRNTMLSVATTPGPQADGVRDPASEPLTPLSPGSDDHLPLINASAPQPARAERSRIREVDAGSVPHDAYPHEYYEREGSVVVEPLPPAYEDLPPRRRVVNLPGSRGR